MTDGGTIIFFPEGAYGPTNNCIGIGDVLRRRGHRVVFVIEESFAGGLLEYPQYTRPAVFRGMVVPAILTSGDHGAVARWRHEQAVERTRRRRPDLIAED